MNLDNLTNETLRHYIPNVVAEVEDEQPLFEKLKPFIASAKLWLESEYLGPDDFLSSAHNELAMRVLVARAFADAVPSLDLILTPSGFGVVSTEAVAPASKERVERLIASLSSYVRANLALLVDICRTYSQWRESERGQYFGSTFFPSLSDYYRWFDGKFKSYDEMRAAFMRIEARLADKYIGRNVMNFLRPKVGLPPTLFDKAIDAIRRSVHKLSAVDNSGFDQNALWHAAEPVIAEIKFDRELYTMWRDEMGELFDDPGFKNDIKGGFYF